METGHVRAGRRVPPCVGRPTDGAGPRPVRQDPPRGPASAAIDRHDSRYPVHDLVCTRGDPDRGHGTDQSRAGSRSVRRPRRGGRRQGTVRRHACGRIEESRGRPREGRACHGPWCRRPLLTVPGRPRSVRAPGLRPPRCGDGRNRRARPRTPRQSTPPPRDRGASRRPHR